MAGRHSSCSTPETALRGSPVDPIALAYLKLYPAPNAGAAGALSNNYITSPNRTQFANSFDVRVDHKFNDRNLFFGRYDYNKVNTFTPPGLGINAATGLQISGGQFDFDGPATDTAQQYGFGFTHIFTQNLLVDLRAAFTRINNLSLPLNSTGNRNADAIVSGGLGTFASNLNSQSTNLTPISFPGLSDIGDGSFVPLQDIDNTFQYLGTVSWTEGGPQYQVRRQPHSPAGPQRAKPLRWGSIYFRTPNRLVTCTRFNRSTKCDATARQRYRIHSNRCFQRRAAPGGPHGARLSHLGAELLRPGLLEGHTEADRALWSSL